MANRTSMSLTWANGVTLILAIWLFVSPWVLAAPAEGAWAWNAWIVAGVIAVLSLGAITQVAQWEDWLMILAGGWLIVSPWILSYSDLEGGAAWNAWAVGAVVALVAIWGVVAARQANESMTAGGVR